jgi:hypothetical protein
VLLVALERLELIFRTPKCRFGAEIAPERHLRAHSHLKIPKHPLSVNGGTPCGRSAQLAGTT